MTGSLLQKNMPKSYMEKQTCTAQDSTLIAGLIQAGNDPALSTVCAANCRRLW
jgi:hypothetical protein